MPPLQLDPLNAFPSLRSGLSQGEGTLLVGINNGFKPILTNPAIEVVKGVRSYNGFAHYLKGNGTNLLIFSYRINNFFRIIHFF